MYVGDFRRRRKESKVWRKAAYQRDIYRNAYSSYRHRTYQSSFPLPSPRRLPSFSAPSFGIMGEIWDLEGVLAAHI
jgi:hypothetical protein